MNLFKWLFKKREENLPYKLIDVTLDELGSYVGHGRYIVLCEQAEKASVIDYLLGQPFARDVGAYEALYETHLIVIWGRLIGGWRRDSAETADEFPCWLRVVESKSAVKIDDLI